MVVECDVYPIVFIATRIVAEVGNYLVSIACEKCEATSTNRYI